MKIRESRQTTLIERLSHENLPLYVAIHCSKALSLRIVCQSIQIKFIKGPVSKLHLKLSASCTFAFDSAGILPSFVFGDPLMNLILTGCWAWAIVKERAFKICIAT